jgi:hypothetical protein
MERIEAEIRGKDEPQTSVGNGRRVAGYSPGRISGCSQLFFVCRETEVKNYGLQGRKSIRWDGSGVRRASDQIELSVPGLGLPGKKGEKKNTFPRKKGWKFGCPGG